MAMDEEDRRRMEDVKLCKMHKEKIDDAKERRDRKLKYDDLGLCAKCGFLHAETTRYGTRRHWCIELKRAVSANDPIVDCTNFFDSGEMSLSMMMSMALPIDAKTHRKVGFIYDEEDEWRCDLDER
jgi:hypothetical protein